MSCPNCGKTEGHHDQCFYHNPWTNKDEDWADKMIWMSESGHVIDPSQMGIGRVPPANTGSLDTIGDTWHFYGIVPPRAPKAPTVGSFPKQATRSHRDWSNH